MAEILFVQGGGKDTHDQWDDKLVDSLKSHLGPTYAVRYPRMPNEADPEYVSWKLALEAEIGALGDNGLIVGHSIGATILLLALADGLPDAPRLGGIFLICPPFVGEGGWRSDEIELSSGLEEKLPARLPVHFYFASADDTVPAGHADLYERMMPNAVVRRLIGRDHQLNNDMLLVAEDILRLQRCT